MCPCFITLHAVEPKPFQDVVRVVLRHMGFCEELWQSAEGSVAAIKQHAFIRSLLDGSLPRDTFKCAPNSWNFGDV